MTPVEVIDRIAQSTAHDGWATGTVDLQGHKVLVARTSVFKLRWIASRLHTFLVAAPFPPGSLAPDRLDAFMKSAMRYAQANKGGLPVGLQTGIAVLTVAVTEHADPMLHGWASKPHGREFGTMPFPVLVDAATGQFTRPPRMIIGGIYSSYLKGMVDHHVGGALAWRPVE